MPFEVGFCLEVGVEVSLGVAAAVMLLQVLLRDEELGTLLALIEFTSLLCGQLQQILVGR